MSLAFSILGLFILIVSIIAHEVAHGYAANALGDPTARLSGRLTFNPLPHLDPIGSIILPALLIFSHSPILFGWAKPVPYNPNNLRDQRFGEAIVAVAGSATNIVLALIFALVARFGASVGLPADAVVAAGLITFVNLFLGLFNLIPFPPLDGFTVLRGVLPWRLSRSLHTFEMKVRGQGPLAIILFLVIFSYFFATPFYAGVTWLASRLI